MKTHIPLLIAFAFFANQLYSQSIVDDEVVFPSGPTTFSSGCLMQSPDFPYYDYIGNYIPDNNTPVKTIQVVFNVFQDQNGGNNFQNNSNGCPASPMTDIGKQTLIDILDMLNTNYGNNYGGSPSDPILSSGELDNRYIQFSLGSPGNERIFFYQDNALNIANCGSYATLRNAVYQADPSRLNYLNVYWTEGSSGGASGCAAMPVYGDGTDLYVLMYGTYSTAVANNCANIWEANIVLRHEFGHNLDLHHTYGAQPWNAPPNCNTSDPNFLDDIFTPSGNLSCPHPPTQWNSDPYASATDGITNNVVGGNDQAYTSPKQIGMMHRALSLKSVRKYVDVCTYTSAQPITISSSEDWDFDLRLYSDLIVQSGCTLDVACKITMPCGSLIHVQPGGTLKMENGSEIVMNDGSRFFIDSGGKLIYDNGTITLNGNTTVLEIAGNLDMQTGSIFTFQGSGYVKFSMPGWNTNNVTAGPGSKMIFSGSGSSDKVLEVAQGTLYPPANLDEFTIENGKVELVFNSFIQPFTCKQIKLLNSLFTSTTGSYNAHHGVHLSGQSGIIVDNCIFEYGKYGIEAWGNCVAAPLNITACTFRYCETGLRTIGTGATLTYCNLHDNTKVGWKAEGNNAPSKFIWSSAFNNTEGISFVSSGPGNSLLSAHSYIHYNASVGIRYESNGTLSLLCGRVHDNGLNSSNPDKAGIVVGFFGDLNMSPVFNAGKVGVNNNSTSIRAKCAKNLYLAGGLNDLSTVFSGGKIVQGTKTGYLGGSAFLVADNNQWYPGGGGPPLQTDYSLQKCFFGWGNITLVDNNPQPYSLCPIAPPDPPTLPPFNSCPLCPYIITPSFPNVKLNDAVMQTIEYMEANNGWGNDLTAVQMFSEILSYPFPLETDDIKMLRDLAYGKMKDALGEAFAKKGTAEDSLFNPAVQQLLDVQHAILQKAHENSDYDGEFYTMMDEAFTYRLAKQINAAVQIMDYIGSCLTLDNDQNAWFTELRTLVTAEQIVMTGQMPKEKFFDLLDSNFVFNNSNPCNGSPLKIIAQVNSPSDSPFLREEIDADELSIHLNPTTGKITVAGKTESATLPVQMTVYNSLGMVIYKVPLNSFPIEVDLSAQHFGVYFYKVHSSTKIIGQGNILLYDKK